MCPFCGEPLPSGLMAEAGHNSASGGAVFTVRIECPRCRVRITQTFELPAIPVHAAAQSAG